MRHIIPISGKDSLATAIVQMGNHPDLPYEFLFNDTYAELPETYAWIDKVEDFLKKPIQRVGLDLKSYIINKKTLPSPRSRFCTAAAKIDPMKKMFQPGEEATIYYGIRADEAARATGIRKRKGVTLLSEYPLVTLGLGIEDVYALLDKHGLRPPFFFWQSIYDAVCEQFPNAVGILEKMPEWERNGLLSWRSRSNCYFCFFQRQYEWIGLLEHYPDLYWSAAEIEESTVEWRDNKKMFTWRRDMTLRHLATRADEVIEKRVRAIIKELQQWQSKNL
jgi:hypothetical protein